MYNKTIKIIKHLLYIIFSNTLYGIIVYYIYAWLVGYSLLYVYIVNLALIIFGLILDEATIKTWNSKKLITDIKKMKGKSREINYRLVRLIFDGFISFKTILYLFYIFILIAAQIIDFYPALISENLMNFIHANNYSILILIALDQLTGQFLKDRKRIKEISEKFEKDFTEEGELF